MRLPEPGDISTECQDCPKCARNALEVCPGYLRAEDLVSCTWFESRERPETHTSTGIAHQWKVQHVLSDKTIWSRCQACGRWQKRRKKRAKQYDSLCNRDIDRDCLPKP